MNKDKLQQELLEKIKGGIKPSDLKKLSKKQSKKPLSPPPIELDQKEKDLGYESDSSIPPAPPLPETKQIKDLKRDVKYWSQTANTHLKNLQLAQAKVSLLEEQVKKQKPLKTESELLKEKNKQIEIIAKENEKNLQKANKATELLNKQSLSIKNAAQLIKQQQQKIAEQDKTIADMKNQAKTTVKDPIENKTFTCSECSQTKSQDQLSRVFGSCSFCLACSKKARQAAQEQKEVKPQPIDFTCVVCDQEKQAIPTYKKVDIPYKTHLIKGQAYPVCSTCATYVKEYNEHENQEFSIGED